MPTISSVLEMVVRGLSGVILVGIFGFTAAVIAAPLASAVALLVLVPTWVHLRRDLLRRERLAETTTAS
jgi:hypothetical protein